jgi:hypothetical protein
MSLIIGFGRARFLGYQLTLSMRAVDAWFREQADLANLEITDDRRRPLARPLDQGLNESVPIIAEVVALAL